MGVGHPRQLAKHGLDASNVKIAVDGDKVHVTGSAPNTEQAEKIAIALGNTVGVQTVQNDIKPTAAAPNSPTGVSPGLVPWENPNRNESSSAPHQNPMPRVNVNCR